MPVVVRRWLVLLALIPAAAASGCDPCFGVVACEGEPRINYEGEIVLHLTDIGVPGTRIDFIRTGGVEIEPDSFSTVTNDFGLFTVEARATSPGEVVGDIVVYPPPPVNDSLRVLPPYRVRDLRLTTTERRGEARFFERWVADPYLDYALELVVRESGQLVPPGALVEVTKVSGIKVVPDHFFVISGPGGRIPISVKAHEAGDIVFDLNVLIPDVAPVFPIPGIQLTTRYVEGETTFAGQLPVGVTMGYVGELYYRDTQQRAAGVQVEFRQTGGPELRDTRFTATTDGFGRFPIMPRPYGPGEVTGTLQLRPPAPYAATSIEIRMSPSTSPRVELLGVWGLGTNLGHLGELVFADTRRPAAGVQVEFRRTEGIAIEPETLTVTTDAEGRFRLIPRPLGKGTVSGHLVIRPPAPYLGLTLPVELSTFESDALRVLGRWELQRP